MVIAACGGGDDDTSAATTAAPAGATTAAPSDAPATTSAPADAPATTAAAQQPPAGAGGGTLVLGDETITLDSARCFLEEQDAAGGGGKILFVAQAFGTTADGEPLVLDISRYDEDSQFTGDDVIVDIGDPFSDDAVSLNATGEIGTVTLDGRNLSAGGLTFNNFDNFDEMFEGSFDVTC